MKGFNNTTNVIYISGTYVNKKYEDLTTVIIQFAEELILNVESLHKVDNKIFQTISTSRSDGITARWVITKDTNTTKLYTNGTNDVQQNPTAEQIANSIKWKQVSLKNSYIVGCYTNDHFRSNSSNYQIFDNTGNIILDEKDTGFTGNYQQKIPVQYMQTNKELQLSNNKIYYKDTETEISKIRQESYRRKDSNSNSNFWCYCMENNSPIEFTTGDDFTFTKSEIAVQTINELNTMLAEIENVTQLFTKEDEISTLKQKAEEWATNVE